MKKCGTCKKEKDLDNFALNYQQKDSHAVYCKVCLAAKARKKYKANPAYDKERKQKLYSQNPKVQKGYQLKYKFGITIEEYDELLTKQNNACAICNSKESKGKGWHVDHDHTTGKVRGILCLSCNTGLGMFKDNVAFLNAAMLYLSD